MRVYQGDPAKLAGVGPTLSVELRQFIEHAYGLQCRHPKKLGGSWNLNLLFFDFMGVRPRVDDLALPLHTMLQRGESLSNVQKLVDTYDSGCETPLSKLERQALPYAMARMSLSYLQYMTIPGDETYEAHCRREFNQSRGPACEWWLTTLKDAAFLKGWV